LLRFAEVADHPVRPDRGIDQGGASTLPLQKFPSSPTIKSWLSTVVSSDPATVPETIRFATTAFS
jgi:hypothetical protein